MGTWGPGNLENDYALNICDDNTARLMRGILKRVRSDTARGWDEYDHDKLFFDFEVLFALESKGLTSWQFFPNAESVREMKEDYISGWLAYLKKDYDSSEAFWKQRRKVIEKTFERFRKLCEKHWQEREG